MNIHDKKEKTEVWLDPGKGVAHTEGYEAADAASHLVEILQTRPDVRLHTVTFKHPKQNITALVRYKNVTDFLALSSTLMQPETVTKPTSAAAIEAAGVLVYCTKTKRFLLQKRAAGRDDSGKYGMFGGKFEPGETAVQAASREAKEEGHFVADPDKLFPLTPMTEPNGVRFYSFLLLVLREFQPILSQESEHAIWVGAKDLEAIPLMPAMKALFATDPTLKRFTNPEVTEAPNAYKSLIEEIIGQRYEDDDGPSAA